MILPENYNEGVKGIAHMFYLILLAWLAFDQWSKYWVIHHFFVGESIPVIPGIFHWTFIMNRGAAFGILQNQSVFFLIIVGILCGMYWYYRKQILCATPIVQVGAALLLSGAIGNAIDRYVYHGVIDFMDFRLWPIFNVADIGICIGVLLLVCHFISSDDEM